MAANPARQLERVAIRVVRSWVTAGDRVDEPAHEHGPDYWIRYHDGRVGAGEVGWHEDRLHQQMWARIADCTSPHQVRLPSGWGQWRVSLRVGANLNQLEAKAEQLVKMLREQKRLMADRPQGRRVRTELDRLLHQLGINHIYRHSGDEPAGLVYLIDSAAELIPDDPDVIAAWISAVLADQRYADTTTKLAPIAADERHVFLWSGSLTGIGIDENLQRVGPDRLPATPPTVPAHISHVWAMSSRRTAHASLWTRAAGWHAVPVPDLDDEST